MFQIDNTLLALIHTWGGLGWHLHRVKDVARKSGFTDEAVDAIGQKYKDLGYAAMFKGV